MLALKFIGHADVKVPGILLVGTAFQHALNDFPLVNDQSVFKIEDSLLPVCVPRPATTIMLSTDLCLQQTSIHLLSVGHRCARTRYLHLMLHHSLPDTAQHSTAQHSTAQHSTAQHSTGHSAAQS